MNDTQKDGNNKKSKTLHDAFREAVKEKAKLLETLGEQVQERIAAKMMTPMTAQHFGLARESLHSAMICFNNCNFVDAMFLFSRACVNIGELTGKAQKEKKES